MSELNMLLKWPFDCVGTQIYNLTVLCAGYCVKANIISRCL